MIGNSFDPITAALIIGALVVALVVTLRRYKRGELPKYVPATFKQKGACGLIVAAMLALFAIGFAAWEPFGGYTKFVAGAVWLASMLYVVRLLAILERA
jgi:hypothetical protein